MRTSVTETRWLASVSSWTSPRIKYVGQRMAHLLADAEQADRAAFGGFGLTRHRQPSTVMPRIEALIRDPTSSLSRDEGEALKRPLALLDLEGLEEVARP